MLLNGFRFMSVAFRHEIEFLVCGSPVVDIDALRRHTVCRGGLSMSNVLVKNLFTVLESFSHEERQLFLRCVCVLHRVVVVLTRKVVLWMMVVCRFVWGRNRLPSNDSDWTQPFTINPLTSLSTGSIHLMMCVNWNSVACEFLFVCCMCRREVQ